MRCVKKCKLSVPGKQASLQSFLSSEYECFCIFIIYVIFRLKRLELERKTRVGNLSFRRCATCMATTTSAWPSPQHSPRGPPMLCLARSAQHAAQHTSCQHQTHLPQQPPPCRRPAARNQVISIFDYIICRSIFSCLYLCTYLKLSKAGIN
jgi:hypothetical protein